jgi:hypothetical protein
MWHGMMAAVCAFVFLYYRSETARDAAEDLDIVTTTAPGPRRLQQFISSRGFRLAARPDMKSARSGRKECS